MKIFEVTILQPQPMATGNPNNRVIQTTAAYLQINPVHEYYLVADSDVSAFCSDYPTAKELRIKKYKDPGVTDEDLSRFAKLLRPETNNE